MKVSPFEMDAGRAEQPAPPYGEPQPGTVMSTRRDDEDNEPDREATIEEPGYGHGV